MSRQEKLTKNLRAGILLAVKAVGKQTVLAAELGISCQAISQWDCVPASRLLEVERISGVPREKLRPDLYR